MSSKPRSFLASPKGLKQLQAAKDRLNLRFAAIARQARVSADTVRRLFHPERGKRVSQLNIVAIAQVLGLLPEEIVYAGEWQIETVDDAAFAEAERRIQEALETGTAELDLSKLELASLPESIGQLSKLSNLYLYQNQLTHLPESIGQLSNLSKLYLSQNQLTHLPESIGQLSNLSELSLSQNQLTRLPESVGQLSKLSKLYLSQNQLIRLPESIGQLSNLSKLYLSQNQLTRLPESIGQLSNLLYLDLYQNQLTRLPKELGQLTNITLFNHSDGIKNILKV